MYTNTVLIFQLNSMLRNGRRLLRSGSAEANAAGLDKSVLYMVRKLVESLADLVHYEGEGCNTERFLKEIIKAICK